MLRAALVAKEKRPPKRPFSKMQLLRNLLVAASTATVASATTAAATIAATATAVSATAAAAITAAAAATTGRASFTGTSFVNRERTTFNSLAVELCDGRLSFSV